MIPGRLLNRSLSWIQPAVAIDPYGDETTSFAEGVATVTEIRGRIDQAAARESVNESRDLALSDLVLYTNTLGIKAEDVIVDGTTRYSVLGVPFTVDTPLGSHHLEVRLRLADFTVNGVSA